MNKSNFVKLLANKMNTPLLQADKTLKTIFDIIGEILSKENTLNFIGFGAFKTSISKAKKVKTPKGIVVNVPEKRVVKFTVGSALKSKVNIKNE